MLAGKFFLKKINSWHILYNLTEQGIYVFPQLIFLRYKNLTIYHQLLKCINPNVGLYEVIFITLISWEKILKNFGPDKCEISEIVEIIKTFPVWDRCGKSESYVGTEL